MLKLNFDKRSHLYGLFSLTWILGISLFLVSCSVTPEPLSLEEQMIQIEEDLAAITAEKKPLTKELTLYEAMARAVKYNFRQRLSAYEVNLKRNDIDLKRLDMLPELNIGYNRSYRNNDPEATFISSSTGQPALQTVDYDDRNKSVASLELSWNILDFGLSYARAQKHADQYLIAKENRRKILQGLIEETRIAYYRAATADKILTEIDSLIKEAELNLQKARHIEEVGLKAPTDILAYQSSLLETTRNLLVRRKSLTTAKLELATLINLENAENYKIAFNEVALETNIPKFDMSGEALEMFALMNRPEIKEVFYEHRGAVRDVRTEVMNTLPGLGFSVGGNYDSNSILENTQWLSLATGFAGNLMRIFTLDNRVENAEFKEKLVALKRKALVAAVMGQVKMSYTRFDVAQKDYDVYKDLARVNQRLLTNVEWKLDEGEVSKADLLAAKARVLTNKLEQYYAYIDVHGEYARLISTLGMDVLPAAYGEMEVDQLAAEIEKSFGAVDYKTIETLVGDMRQKTKLYIEEKAKKKAAKKPKKKKAAPLKDINYMGFTEVND